MEKDVTNQTTYAATHVMEKAEFNRQYYDGVWSGVKLMSPSRFNTWPIFSSLVADFPHCLEIGPGLRPRLPINGTNFLDLSPVVVDRINQAGGYARVGNINALPYPDRHFDMVCAFDVIEHVFDDQQAFRELSRVIIDNGLFSFSVPLHEDLWTSFDSQVGHHRRYQPEHLQDMMTSNDFILEQSAVYGMKPRSQSMIKLGMWLLSHFQRPTLFLYDLFIFPLGLRLQKPLNFVPGLIATTEVEKVLFMCRRAQREEQTH